MSDWGDEDSTEVAEGKAFGGYNNRGDKYKSGNDDYEQNDDDNSGGYNNNRRNGGYENRGRGRGRGRGGPKWGGGGRSEGNRYDNGDEGGENEYDDNGNGESNEIQVSGTCDETYKNPHFDSVRQKLLSCKTFVGFLEKLPEIFRNTNGLLLQKIVLLNLAVDIYDKMLKAKEKQIKSNDEIPAKIPRQRKRRRSDYILEDYNEGPEKAMIRSSGTNAEELMDFTNFLPSDILSATQLEGEVDDSGGFTLFRDDKSLAFLFNEDALLSADMSIPLPDLEDNENFEIQEQSHSSMKEQPQEPPLSSHAQEEQQIDVQMATDIVTTPVKQTRYSLRPRNSTTITEDTTITATYSSPRRRQRRTATQDAIPPAPSPSPSPSQLPHRITEREYAERFPLPRRQFVNSLHPIRINPNTSLLNYFPMDFSLIEGEFLRSQNNPVFPHQNFLSHPNDDPLIIESSSANDLSAASSINAVRSGAGFTAAGSLNLPQFSLLTFKDKPGRATEESLQHNRNKSSRLRPFTSGEIGESQQLLLPQMDSDLLMAPPLLMPSILENQTFDNNQIVADRSQIAAEDEADSLLPPMENFLEMENLQTGQSSYLNQGGGGRFGGGGRGRGGRQGDRGGRQSRSEGNRYGNGDEGGENENDENGYGESNDSNRGGGRFGGGGRGRGGRQGDRGGRQSDRGGRREFNNNKGEYENENGDDNEGGEEQKPREFYIPPEPTDNEEEIFGSGITSGIHFNKYDSIPVKVTGENAPEPIQTFDDAGFRDIVANNITRSGYTTPTPIQKTAIPVIAAGRDLMACAQTGSGKTASFLLPIINSLLQQGAETAIGRPLALVVSPTRELAIQIFNEARKFALGSYLNIRIVYGGTSSKHQGENMSKGISHILIATPGRLLDFVEKGFISFDDTRFVVLDEADRMLDMGFKENVATIMNHPTMRPQAERQNLMFSATFPEDIQRMAGEYLNEYIFIAIGVVGGACSDVTQNVYEVKKFQKRNKLLEILQENPDGTIVFVETKRGADFLASLLSETEFPTTSIHGDRLQRQRESALQDFKSGRMKVLIATSVAARGLDIKNVNHVVVYDMPSSIDDYVHRIGRTGRVGNNGRATTFFDPDNDSAIAADLVRILEDAGQEVPDFLKNYSSGGGGGNNGGGSRFGGKDFRKLDNNQTSGPAPLEEDEDWG